MRKNITEHQCHPEPVSELQKLRRFRNKFGMTINILNPVAPSLQIVRVENAIDYSIFPQKTKIKNPDYSFENLYMIVRKIYSFLLGLNYLTFHLFCFEFQ